MEGPPLSGFSLAVGCCRNTHYTFLSLSCNHETQLFYCAGGGGALRDERIEENVWLPAV